VFDGSNHDSATFGGNFLSTKKLHLPNDLDNEHYNVITNLKGAMAKQNICNGCDTLHYKTHKCDKVCSCILLQHPSLRITQRIILHATGGFSVSNVSRIN